jgi:hypothetical protein
MGLFTDIGYARLAKQRKERFIREGRQGESLGFYNRPDLNDPWNDDLGDDDCNAGRTVGTFAGVFLAILVLAIVIDYVTRHPS